MSLSIANELLERALNSPHQEICGLVSYELDTEEQHSYALHNISSSPATHFEMDPKQLVEYIKTIRSENCHLLAIYHSHPNGDIRPSATDIQQHQYPELYYFVISPGNDGVLKLGAFILEGHRVEAIELTTNQ